MHSFCSASLPTFRGATLAFPAAILAVTLWHASLTAASAQGEISYQKPSARIVKNKDGTKLTIKVDPYNQRVEETFEETDKSVRWRLVRELDETFQPVRATKYDGRNQVISKHRYLTLKGRIEEEEVLDANNNLLSKLVFYYDAKARMTKVEQFNSRGVLVSVSRSSGLGVEPMVQQTPTVRLPPSTSQSLSK